MRVLDAATRTDVTALMQAAMTASEGGACGAEGNADEQQRDQQEPQRPSPAQLQSQAVAQVQQSHSAIITMVEAALQGTGSGAGGAAAAAPVNSAVIGSASGFGLSQVVQQKPRIVSQQVFLLYFQSLLEKKMIDNLFVTATELAAGLKGFPFAAAIIEFLNSQATPALLRCVRASSLPDSAFFRSFYFFCRRHTRASGLILSSFPLTPLLLVLGYISGFCYWFIQILGFHERR